jgi:hypothetical protein
VRRDVVQWVASGLQLLNVRAQQADAFWVSLTRALLSRPCAMLAAVMQRLTKVALNVSAAAIRGVRDRGKCEETDLGMAALWLCGGWRTASQGRPMPLNAAENLRG